MRPVRNDQAQLLPGDPGYNVSEMNTIIITLFLSVWPFMLVGAGLIILFAWLGWRLAATPHPIWVQFVTWWVEDIVMPLLHGRSWLLRTLVIFLNNSVVLAIVLAAGVDSLAAAVAVSLLGVNIGIGVRVLSGQGSDDRGQDIQSTGAGNTRSGAALLGMLLNMLEPPAILIVMGMSLGQSWIPLPPDTIWRVFLTWVLPLLLLAAGGEATWIGVLMKPPDAGPPASH